jgi:hypothetical protein
MGKQTPKPYKKRGGSQSCFFSFEIIHPKEEIKNKIEERVTDASVNQDCIYRI